MKYKSKQHKDLEDRIKAIYSVGEGDEHMAKKLSRLSGMKGAEKKSKDKLGKLLNRNNQIADKVFKRMEKRLRGQYDS